MPAGSFKTSIKPDLLDGALQKARNTLVHMECGPGDVVLFSNLLIHRGGVNTTEKIRWSFDWRFQDAKQDTLREDKGHVVWAKSSEYCNDGVAVVRTPQEWAELTLSGK